ncbi:ABC transporter permease [bacterium]|nr:ABC transporter permease [bacterium]
MIITNTISLIGKETIFFISSIGGIFMLFFSVLKEFFKTDRKRVYNDLFDVGVGSMPIILLTGVFVGSIMVIQTGFYVREFQMGGIMGWSVGFFSFREIAPLMAGVMFSGRIGAWNSAQLGHMKISKQIDTLFLLDISPIAYMVVPRFISMVIMITVLTFLSNIFVILSGIFSSWLLLDISINSFLDSFHSNILFDDLSFGLIKVSFFGAIIAIISSYFGLKAEKTAENVGKMVKISVVWSAISIFLFDYILSSILS